MAAFKEHLPNEPRWPNTGEKLLAKDRRIYVATYPTMLVRESGSDRLVLDTKWKLIDDTRSNGTDKYGLAQADFYQLYAYGQSYLDGVGDVSLIYPKTDTFRNPLEVFDFSKATGLRLWVLPFCLRERKLTIPKNAPFVTNFHYFQTVME